MKLKNLFTLFVLSFTILLTGYSQETLSKIVERGEIIIGTSGNQPPFTMKSKDGKLMGYEIDLAKVLAESMGVKLQLVEIPFPGLLDALEEGKVDAVMSGMAMTPKRNLNALFAGPYMISGKSILTKSSVLSGIESANEMNDEKYKITCLKSSTSEDFAKTFIADAELILVDNYNDAVNLVLTDQADAMVADAPICMVSILKHQGKGLVTLDRPLTIEPIGMALPSNDIQFLNLIDNYLASMELSGALELFLYMWFEDGSWLLNME